MAAGGWRSSTTGSASPPTGGREAFAPLVRLHGESEAPAAAGNSGLGLATCQRTVGAHRGEIGLADGVDGGTTAWFTLPG